MDSSGLVIYDSMVSAIDRCYRVDEVKDLRDKAMAFEHYARQAQNVEAERKAIEVRIRAERRAGQLLKEMDTGRGKHKGEDGKFHSLHDETNGELSEKAKAKSEANISDTQAHRWQKLAEIPHETFEGKLQNPLVRPTTTGLLNGAKPEPRQAPDDALWLWGHLRDFERETGFQDDINEIVEKMSQALQSDVRRIVPQLIDWLGGLRYSE